MRAGSPPSCCMASRMAARSTTQGTPVKSWSRTRLGVKAISLSGLEFLFVLGTPGGHRTDVFFFYIAAVFGAQQIFEQDAQAIREMFGGDALLVERVEAVDFVFFVADFESGAGVERV